MTFEQLKEKIRSKEIKADWHQHKNGGGWRHKGAKVDETAYVGDNAIVWGSVSGDARVSGGRVYGDAWVYGGAWEKSPLFIIGTKHSLTNAKNALREVVKVLESNSSSITDTVWVTGNAPETLLDHCKAALEAYKGKDA
jgi:hypothetical protein